MIGVCLYARGYHRCRFKKVWWRDKEEKSGTNGAISGKYDETCCQFIISHRDANQLSSRDVISQQLAKTKTAVKELINDFKVSFDFFKYSIRFKL